MTEPTIYLDAAVRVTASTWLRGGESAPEILAAVHSVLQGVIRYRSDRDQFGCAQRIVSPDETLQASQGDCEDYAWCVLAVAARLGVPEDEMHIMACRVDGQDQVHAVLVWRLGADSLVVDSQLRGVRPLDRRPDLSELRELDLACFPRFAGQSVPALRLA